MPQFVHCAGKQWPRCAFAEAPSRFLLHIPASRSEPQPASSRLAADLRPSSCSARSNLEPSRHRLRRWQNPCRSFRYHTCHVSCSCMHYDLSIRCLCRAFAPVYLFIYLYLSLVLWKCTTPCCPCVVASRCVVDLCALFLVWCGWLVVDRAVEPVERVTCLNVAIASSSRHGRSAKHAPSLVLSLFFFIYLPED